MAEFRKLELHITGTAAKPGTPVPEASESGEAAEAQAPNGYTIGLDDRGWYFLTPLGAKSRPWNDRGSAVDGAFDHANNRSPYTTDSPNQGRAIADDHETRQEAVEAAWSAHGQQDEREASSTAS